MITAAHSAAISKQWAEAHLTLARETMPNFLRAEFHLAQALEVLDDANDYELRQRVLSVFRDFLYGVPPAINGMTDKHRVAVLGSVRRTVNRILEMYEQEVARGEVDDDRGELHRLVATFLEDLGRFATPVV